MPRTLPWWRRLAAALVPTRPDRGERLAAHHAAEIRLAEALAREAESLTLYPLARRRILEAAERARGRAQRVRQALEEAGYPAPVPATRNGSGAPMGWEGLRAGVRELNAMSDAYLMDAYAMERWYPEIAELLHELQRDTAASRRDLVWPLAQMTNTALTTTWDHDVAA
jgi:hypothetical protein